MKDYLFYFLIYLICAQFASCCSIQNCLSCDKNASRCLKCSKGFFQYLGKCYTECPDNLYADNYYMTCKHRNESPIFIKAYTVSRCINSCGKKFFDCSCEDSCTRTGTCCSDYRFCEIIFNNFIELKKDSDLRANCKYASANHKSCFQCQDGFFYYKAKCYERCPSGAITQYKNHFCLDTGKCLKDSDTHCEKCNNNGQCLECTSGYYLHENKCLKICPVGYKGNRIDFKCRPLNIFAFYWIYPSKATCQNQCGKDFSECSCNDTCKRKGNCCDDYDGICEKRATKCKNCRVWNDAGCVECKDNASLNRKGECPCNEPYEYSEIEDLCLFKWNYEESQEQYFIPQVDEVVMDVIATEIQMPLPKTDHIADSKKKSDSPKNPNIADPKKSQQKKPFQGMIGSQLKKKNSNANISANELKKELLQSFDTLFSYENLNELKTSQKHHVHIPRLIVFNGNSTLNVYSKNQGIQIRNDDEVNNRSFNRNLESKNYLRSKNILLASKSRKS